jgi:uncharacterized protein (DUF2336 family)
MMDRDALIKDLENAVARGTAESRLAALWHATDLLIAGRYSEDEIWTFGEVIGLLAAEIELAARAELARRLAPSANAPVKVVNGLASDDAIDVAGPVLRRSERLDDRALIENARCKGQAHLLAISQRRSLSEDVTDVLVTHGNREVVRSVTRNQGARFSDSGFWHLVRRSEHDMILAECVGMRKDIPRHHFQKLIAKASDEVKARLAAANPGVADEVRHVVADVAGTIQGKFGPVSPSYFEAKRFVGELYRSGHLSPNKVCEFARSRQFEKVTVALSLLCELPVDVVERALLDDRCDMVLILAKACDLSWTVTKFLLLLRAPDAGISAHDLDDALSNFDRLTVATARQVLRFYRSRREDQASVSGQNRLAPLHRM